MPVRSGNYSDKCVYQQQEKFQVQRIAFWNQVASQKTIHGLASGYYHNRVKALYKHFIPPNQRVLEVGCSDGDLLASVSPAFGMGIDFSETMIERARQKYPDLHFVCMDAMHLEIQDQFDFIILSDLINDVWDVQRLLEVLQSCCHSGTRIILNYYSRLWTPVLNLSKRFRWAQPTLEQSWLTTSDLKNLLQLSGYQTVRESTEIILPAPIPLLEPLFNKFLVRFWPFSQLALTNLLIARPHTMEEKNAVAEFPSVSVIVPARNEAGNIAAIFDRVPKMGRFTEIIFVEGNSTDNTYSEIEHQIKLHPHVDARLFKQTGKGKGDAVRLGFSQAKGDILMILDADLTVPPEDLPRFYSALLNRSGEFINGVRLVYPMEKQAMRLINFLGNKFFSLTFSWLLWQPVKDTLCGTKVLYKRDYEKIAQNRSYFGDFDPFGDFDLLFGAAKLNMKIIDVPIRYQERRYGTTNIQRWKHGWLLLQMTIFGLNRIKFI